MDNNLTDKLIALQEAFSQYTYHPSPDKAELMMDFFLIAALPSSPSPAVPPSEENDNLKFVLQDIRKDFYPWMKNEMLKAVQFCVSCEFRHVFERNEGKDILAWAKKRGPADVDFFKKYTTYFAALNGIHGMGHGLARTLVDIENIRREFKDEESARKISYRAMKQTKVDPKLFLEIARDAYVQLKWNGSYGGEPWSKICAAWLKLNDAQTDKDIVTYVDHMYDLQHNTSTVFNKLTAYVQDGGYKWLQNALDYKYHTESLYDLFGLVSPDLKRFASAIIKNFTGDNLESWMKRGGKLDSYKDSKYKTFGYGSEVEYTGPREELHGKVGKVKGDDKGAYSVDFGGGQIAHGILPKYLENYTGPKKVVPSKKGTKDSFKVGDMVKIIKSGANTSPKDIGKITTVLAVGGEYGFTGNPGIKVDTTNLNNKDGNWSGAHAYELVQSATSGDPLDSELLDKMGIKPGDIGESLDIKDASGNEVHVGDLIEVFGISQGGSQGYVQQKTSGGAYVYYTKKIGSWSSKNSVNTSLFHFNKNIKIISPFSDNFSPPDEDTEETGSSIEVGSKVKIIGKFNQAKDGLYWNDAMNSTVGQTGTVMSIKDNGNFNIKFPTGNAWEYLPKVVQLVGQESAKSEEVDGFKKGDKVEIIKDGDIKIGNKITEIAEQNGITNYNLDKSKSNDHTQAKGTIEKIVKHIGNTLAFINLDNDSYAVCTTLKNLKLIGEKLLTSVVGFKKGDKVKVIHTGNVYPGYNKMAEAMGLTNWKNSNNDPDEGDIGIIIAFGKHSSSTEAKPIAGVKLDNGKEILIGVDGIEKITGSAEISNGKPLNDNKPGVQVGDQVVCVDPGNYSVKGLLTKGKTYTVISVGSLVKVKGDKGEDVTAYPHRFAKVSISSEQKSQFNEGDIVELINSTDYAAKKGAKAKVVTDQTDPMNVKVQWIDDKGKGQMHGTYDAIDFKLVTGADNESNQELKVGDKVKIIKKIHPEAVYDVGATGTVVKVKGSLSGQLAVDMAGEVKASIKWYEWEKIGSSEAKKTKFNIGDKIKVKSGPTHWSGSKHGGDTGQVVVVDTKDNSVKVDLNKTGEGVWFAFNEVELLSGDIESVKSFKTGDQVKLVKKIEEIPGGLNWVDKMDDLIGKSGKIVKLYHLGYVGVVFSSDAHEWFLSPDSLELVGTGFEAEKKFNKGDEVIYTGTNGKIDPSKPYTFVAYLKGKKQVKIKGGDGKIYYPFADNLKSASAGSDEELKIGDEVLFVDKPDITGEITDYDPIKKHYSVSWNNSTKTKVTIEQIKKIKSPKDTATLTPVEPEASNQDTKGFNIGDTVKIVTDGAAYGTGYETLYNELDGKFNPDKIMVNNTGKTGTIKNFGKGGNDKEDIALLDMGDFDYVIALAGIEKTVSSAKKDDITSGSEYTVVDIDGNPI